MVTACAKMTLGRYIGLSHDIEVLLWTAPIGRWLMTAVSDVLYVSIAELRGSELKG